MKHAGKAAAAGRRILGLSILAFAVIGACGWWALSPAQVWGVVATALAVVWVLFAGFVLNFFRDPGPVVPGDPDVVVAPAHGKVDVIEEVEEPEFVGGRCQRVSIFLSVFDVHIQYAPLAGRVVKLRHKAGRFVNALRPDASLCNENVLVQFAPADRPDDPVVVRLIAGLIARRILPWIAVGDTVARGERISLIQFGSRVDLYLPGRWKVGVRLGDRVRGGETILARREVGS